MDSGQIVFVSSRLVLGAVGAFLAIMLWSKTRDAAWLLAATGTIAGYIEIVYSILNMFGITADYELYIGSVSLAAIILPALRMAFFIAAFLVMIIRKYRH
ncbi:MAG: hypothetical protein LBD48_06745 [Treponema sp.]|jgi:hypothetical protein|nr:hypothetical protein [Treponema sp.]